MDQFCFDFKKEFEESVGKTMGEYFYENYVIPVSKMVVNSCYTHKKLKNNYEV